MKVLVLGATGFVGNPVALAYVRAGHDVYGVTRNESKAQELQAEEITPVVASRPEGWEPLVDNMDLIVDASVTLGPDWSYKNIEIVSKGAQGRPQHLKLTYIYTSGTWSYGDSEEWRDERNNKFTGDGLVAWRPAIEEAVISNKDFNGIVIRPGCVYGRSGSLTGMLFEEATKAAQNGHEAFAWPATPGKRWTTIHQDDVAELFLRVGEAAPTTKHTVFDAVNAASESVDDILTAVGGLVGVKYRYTEIPPGILQGMDLQTLSKPSLGRAMLGWVPRKKSLVDGLPTYYKAWKATQDRSNV